ncbi:MAG: hypothetical protein ACOCU9_03020 [Spirochaetota bacterium]
MMAIAVAVGACVTQARSYTMYAGDGVQQVFVRPFEVSEGDLQASFDITAQFQDLDVHGDATINFSVYSSSSFSLSDTPDVVLAISMDEVPLQDVTLLFRDSERGVVRYSSRVPSDAFRRLLDDVDDVLISFSWQTIHEDDIASPALRDRLRLLAGHVE